MEIFKFKLIELCYYSIKYYNSYLKYVFMSERVLYRNRKHNLSSFGRLCALGKNTNKPYGRKIGFFAINKLLKENQW
jgi:hypothetical protein